jgi:hypothetical protein
VRKMFAFLGLTTALFFSAAHAVTTVFSTDFGTGYTNGSLVGQNGWSQTGTIAQTVLQTIDNGAVVLPSGTTGQDTWNAFSSVVDSGPTAAGNSLLAKINFSITSATSSTGDYFFHLLSPANTTPVFFQRLFARGTAGGFQLGINSAQAAGLPRMAPRRYRSIPITRL